MKKIILSLLIVLTIFIVTGCKEVGKETFVDMLYDEPNGYSQKEPVDIDNNKVLVYHYKEDESKSINLYYYKDKKLGDLVDESLENEEKEINGFKWRIYHANDFGVVYDTYDYEYKGALYRIELNGVDKYKEEFNTFINSVSFK